MNSISFFEANDNKRKVSPSPIAGIFARARVPFKGAAGASEASLPLKAPNTSGIFSSRGGETSDNLRDVDLVYPLRKGVYPLGRNSDFRFDIHPYGVSVRSDIVPPRPTTAPHRTRRITHMSRYTKKRIIKKTAILEFFGLQPTHMLTVTLPPERWEALTVSRKVRVWRNAKGKFLKAMQKKVSGIAGYGYMHFQEFQMETGRGAPHLHIILKMHAMTRKEWRKWLDWFISEWKKALEWEKEDGEYPRQGVDFQKLRYQDFRYARAYMSKNEQKEAPFEANWGRWWGVGGAMRLKNIRKQYDVKLDTDELNGLNHIIGNYRWLTWSKIHQMDTQLYEKLMSHIKTEKWTHDDTIRAKKYSSRRRPPEGEFFEDYEVVCGAPPAGGGNLTRPEKKCYNHTLVGGDQEWQSQQ